MSKLIIFAPNTGGNHIANIIGAGQNLDNCINDQLLLQNYTNNININSNHHFNNLFLHHQTNIRNNCIYIGHLDQVWQNYKKIKGIIQDILIISIQGYATKKLRGYYTLSYLEEAVYTKEFLENIFLNENLYTIHFNDILNNFDVLKFVLDDTPFHIESKYEKHHNLWLKNIKKKKNRMFLKEEIST